MKLGLTDPLELASKPDGTHQPPLKDVQAKIYATPIQTE